MKFAKKILHTLRSFNSYSKLAVKLGAATMLCLYIMSLFAYLIAPKMPNYFVAMTIHRAGLEAAPVSLAAGICAAILCELMYRTYMPDDKKSKKNKDDFFK